MPNRIFANEHGLPFIEVEGEPRYLGCLKPDTKFSLLPGFATEFGVLPQSQWQENSLKSFNPPQRNQGPYGSCTGQATVTAFTVAKNKSAPLDQIPLLSATFIYGCINHGVDGGAMVSDAMMTITNTGTCLDSQVPTNAILSSNFPVDAAATASRFKVLEAYKVTSFEELCTALTLGIPCVSGLGVGRNFTRNQLQSNGLAYLPDVIVGGHALPHFGLKLLNGIWVVETMNSWGANWGMNGWCYLQKEHWNPGYGFPFDCFAIGSVIDDPQDNQDEPPTIE